MLQLLSLQLAAYTVEARIIGFEEIPPLKDSIQSIQEAKETFLGFYVDDQLAGAVAYEVHEHTLLISRMMVHPDHFRKGIARKLLEHVETAEAGPGIRELRVSTGTKNEPAVQLYLSAGFKPTKETPIAPGVTVTGFVKAI